MGYRSSLNKRIEEQNKRKMNKKPPQDEETDMEMEFIPSIFMNKQTSAMDENAINRVQGINNAPSIFDRKAVFRKDN